MKKVYLFGDSFSLFNGYIKNQYSDVIEFNSHSSLSNDHILKLVKKKLTKLSNENIKPEDGINIFVQLTVATRMLVNYTPNEPAKTSLDETYEYHDKLLEFSDKELFKDKEYYTIYPCGPKDNLLMDMIYRPYLGTFIAHNEKNILNDLLVELNCLKAFAKSLNINFDYIFYSDNFDKLLAKSESTHITLYGHQSIQSYIKSNHAQFFMTPMDIHFNDEGNLWYINWLKDFYGF
ncbi:MAG: hypothetical protein RLZZ196_1345 [Bacteroidota bacterium]|jgi:hypothetical protein